MGRSRVIFITCILLASMLCACTGASGVDASGAGQADEKSNDASTTTTMENTKDTSSSLVNGDMFETDRFSLTVPEGWERYDIDGGVQLYKPSGEIIEVYVRGYNQSDDWARQQAVNMAEQYGGTEPRQVERWGKLFWNTAFTAADIPQASYLCIENGETLAVKVAGPDYENDAETQGILESIQFKEVPAATAEPVVTQTPQDTAAPTPVTTSFSIDSAVENMPDELPAELTTFVELNEFATKLYLTYVKTNIFQAPVFSDEEKADARKAIGLILAATDKAIMLDDSNANLFYLRGNTYAQRYYDGKSGDDKEQALSDLQQAVDMGLAMAQSAYDMLAGQ